MPQRNELNFSTGDRVVQSAEYVCDAGETRPFNEGEVFPNCPIGEQENNVEA